VLSTRQALWVWGAPDSDALVAFAQAHQVSELFVEVTPKVATDGSFVRLQYLKAIATAAGIRLYALNGDPSWATNPAEALAWQKAALDTGLFAGTHLDVEPYSLPAWQTDEAGTAAAFLQMLSQLKAAYPLPLEADVPFWYGTYPAPAGATGPTLADAVLSVVDAATVMSYRDTATGANSIVDVGTDMLTRAQAAGKPVRLAAETNPTPDCAVCSFSAATATQLQAALSQVETVAGSYRTFDGMAVEDYNGWSGLAP
jgi:hypothetical protein